MIELNFLMESEKMVRGFNILNRDGQSVLNYNGIYGIDETDAADIRRRNIPASSELGRAITRGVLTSDRNVVAQAIRQYDNNLAPFYVVIQVQGVTGTNIRNAVPNLFSKSGKTVKDPNKARSWVKPTTLARRYKINRLINRLPFTNYENNDSGDVNCVLHYFLTRHKRLSKNKLKKAFGDGCDMGKLIDYVEGMKLPTKLVNFNGRVLYENDYTSKDHRVYAMIADNHFYPLKPRLSKFTPDRVKNTVEEDKYDFDTLVPEDMILINSNNTYYTPDGVYSPYGFEYDETFMDNLRINYTHPGDIHSLSCLLFVHNKKINNMKYEYDLSNAYPNVATNWSHNEVVGIFGCFDMWKPFNTGHLVLNVSHYAITDEAVKRLRRFGIHDNVMDGYQTNLLLEEGYLSKKDITHVKKPSQRKSFNYYKQRFLSLKERLTKGLTEGTKEYKDKLNQIRIYIGLVAKYQSVNFTSIIGMGTEDHELLNFNSNYEVWKKANLYEEDDLVGATYTRESTTKKSINGCHIRNYIVSYTNRILLRNMIRIYEKTKKLPVKIVTDCIGYEEEQELVDNDKFKLQVDPLTTPINKQQLPIKKENLKKYNVKVTRQYHNITEIQKQILENIEKKITKNKTITGAPGTGKTHVMKQHPKIYDMCATITNMCKRNMDDNAQTLYSLLLQHNATRNRLANIYERLKLRRIWIDEFSMIPNKYWNILFDACMYYRTTLFLTGDINQIPPIHSDRIKLKNPIVKLFFGEVTTLTKDYRNDDGIIKIRDAVLHQKGIPSLSKRPYEECENHIVLTHTMRKYINLKILKQRGETFTYKDGLIDVSIGCTIKSRTNLRDLEIYKNELYTVLSKDKKKKTWTIKNKYYNHTVTISYKDMNNFDIGYANTYHSTQGLTFKNKFCLHEVTRAYEWNPSILYTGITRGTTRKNVRLYDTDHKCDGCNECTYTLPSIEIFEE